MDRICVALLDRINKLSPEGRYVIIDENELFEAFPEECEKSDKELNKALSALKNSGFIDIRYSRGDMYCVAPLKEYVEKISAPPPAKKSRAKIDSVFLSAFAGGALGALLITLIFALI